MMAMTQSASPGSGPPLEPVGWAAVIITPREIYDGLVRVSAQLAAIQQQLVQHTDEHERRDVAIDARFQDHEDRIRAIETNRWPLPSIAALTGVAGAAVSVFVLLR